MKNKLETEDKLDAHAHVFHRSDKSVKDARYIPDYDASLNAWLATLDAKSLAGGTLVQPSFLGTDNSRLLASISEAQTRGYSVNGAAVVPPDISEADLEDLNKQGIQALRLNLIERPLPDFNLADWQDFFELVKSLQIEIEIQLEAVRMSPVIDIIQKTGVALILDHYALVDSVEQLAHILRNSDRAILCVKRSAPYRLPIQNLADRERLAEELDLCLAQYLTPEKTPWGSDWPHTRFEKLVAG